MASQTDTEGPPGGPAASEAEAVFLHIQRTAEVLMRGVAATLKPVGLTPTQYNVLRILRGAAPAGLRCGEISERMVNHDPDITRLLERLVAQGLITRTRAAHDRRVVLSVITPEGLRILKSLDAPIKALHRRQLGQLGAQGLTALSALLVQAQGD